MTRPRDSKYSISKVEEHNIPQHRIGNLDGSLRCPHSQVAWRLLSKGHPHCSPLLECSYQCSQNAKSYRHCILLGIDKI